MMKKILAGFVAAFFATAAFAQNPGPVTNHAFAIGKGAGVTGYSSMLCTSAQIAVGQAAADPICRTVTGDWTISAAGAATLATVNANVGAFGSATSCVTFTTNGKGLITAASQATCTPAIGSVTGLGTGVGTALAAATNSIGGLVTGRTPTVQVLTTGTGATYTTPAGVRYIDILGCGGGGGGGTAAGTAGGNTTWSSPAMTGTGGPVGTGAGGGPAVGLAGTGGQVNYVGGDGLGTFTGVAGNFIPRSLGGGSVVAPGTVTPAANSCGGGGGNLASGAASNGGSGAGGGGFRRIIGSPAASYTYTIGAAGTAGTGGVAGGTGVIIVWEY